MRNMSQKVPADECKQSTHAIVVIAIVLGIFIVSFISLDWLLVVFFVFLSFCFRQAFQLVLDIVQSVGGALAMRSLHNPISKLSDQRKQSSRPGVQDE